MSLRAMLWALNDAPVDDPTEAFVLVALADNAWDDGRAAFPSVATIARRCRVSERTVQRTLRRLEDRGVIRRGDQTIAAARYGRYAPTAYDLDLTAVRPDRPEDGDGPLGDAPEDRHGDDAGQTRDSQRRQSVTPERRQSVTPESRGDTDDTQGVTLVSPNPSYNPPVVTKGGNSHHDAREKNPPESTSRTATPAAADAADRPAERDEHGPLFATCTEHRLALDPPPCRRCADQREAFDVAETRRRAARERDAARREAQERNAYRRNAIPATAGAARARQALRKTGAKGATPRRGRPGAAAAAPTTGEPK